MCLSHLVTIGGTDRGAVGQSGVGVLEWVILNSACVDLPRNGWMAWFSCHLLFFSLTFQHPPLAPSLLCLKLSYTPLCPNLYIVYVVFFLITLSPISLPLQLSISPPSSLCSITYSSLPALIIYSFHPPTPLLSYLKVCLLFWPAMAAVIWLQTFLVTDGPLGLSDSPAFTVTSYHFPLHQAHLSFFIIIISIFSASSCLSLL